MPSSSRFLDTECERGSDDNSADDDEEYEMNTSDEEFIDDGDEPEARPEWRSVKISRREKMLTDDDFLLLEDNGVVVQQQRKRRCIAASSDDEDMTEAPPLPPKLPPPPSKRAPSPPQHSPTPPQRSPTPPPVTHVPSPVKLERTESKPLLPPSRFQRPPAKRNPFPHTHRSAVLLEEQPARQAVAAKWDFLQGKKSGTMFGAAAAAAKKKKK